MSQLARIQKLQEEGMAYEEAYDTVMENDQWSNHIYFEQLKDHLEDGRLYESDPEDKYDIRDIEGE
jgi:hypothetical protein